MPPQLVDRSDHGVGVQVAGLGEEVEGEVAADRGREPGGLTCMWRHLLETPLQHGGEMTVGRDLPGFAGFAGTAQGLEHVEGVAARRGHEQRDLLVLHGALQHRCPELAHTDIVQGRQLDLRQRSRGPERAQQLRHVGIARQLVLARRCRHQQWRLAGPAQQERQPRGRLRVAPLQVVEHQDRRPVHGQDGLREPLEEPVPPPGVDHRSRGRRLRGRPVAPVTGRAFGDEPRDLDSPGFVEVRDGAMDAGAAQPVGDRGEREPSGHPEAARRGDDRTVGPCLDAELGHQPALADAGVAVDDQQLWVPLGGSAPARARLAELPVAPHQPPACDGRSMRLARSAPDGPGLVAESEQLLRELGRGRGRLDAELALHDLGALVEGAHRAGPVA